MVFRQQDRDCFARPLKWPSRRGGPRRDSTRGENDGVFESHRVAVAVENRRAQPARVRLLRGLGVRRFGSIDAAFAYLSGDRLFVDATTQSFGTVDAGDVKTVAFRLTNLDDRDVEIVGAKASCSCVAATRLPLRIPPHASRLVEAKVDTAKKTGAVEERLHVSQLPLAKPRSTCAWWGRCGRIRNPERDAEKRLSPSGATFRPGSCSRRRSD